MSTFIWGKIEYKELPKEIEHYQKNDIQVLFSRKDPKFLFSVGLKENEWFFNISCGYSEKMLGSYLLNCHERFFSLDKPSKVKDWEQCLSETYERLKRLQDFIIELLNNPNIESMVYFHTDTGNETSIDEYEAVDWEAEEFADRFFERIKEASGCTPTIKVFFKRHQ